MGFMVWMVLFPGRKLAAVIIILEVVSCILDQNRWQPWEYQFIFMMAGMAFYANEKNVSRSWQVIIASLYFFSGLSKCNSAFIHDIWQNLLLGQWLGISSSDPWILRFGYVLPLVEMAAGVGLLFLRTRKPAVFLLAGMHVLVLLVLGPTGLQVNQVIWPWNILLPVLLFLLFYKSAFEFDAAFMRHRLTWVIVLSWCILPWLQLVGYWDKYLSAVLYSGGITQLYICTNDERVKQSMQDYMEDKFWVIPCSPVLSAYTWGMKEMNTAPYPEPRIYKRMILEWKKTHPGDARFFLFTPGFAPKLEEIQ
jgi:hypothetical protein